MARQIGELRDNVMEIAVELPPACGASEGLGRGQSSEDVPFPLMRMTNVTILRKSILIISVELVRLLAGLHHRSFTLKIQAPKSTRSQNFARRRFIITSFIRGYSCRKFEAAIILYTALPPPQIRSLKFSSFFCFLY